jgi:hypothetical protein
MTIQTGGFSGDNALLAFAAVQQGRMNEELSEAMRSADTRSQVVKEVSDLKARMQEVNSYSPNDMPQLDAEVQAFMAKYAEVPEAQDVISTLEPYAKAIHDRVEEYRPSGDAHKLPSAPSAGNPAVNSIVANVVSGRGGYPIPQHTNSAPRDIPAFDKDQVKGWLDNIQETLDAAGTNDQLTMVHIKQLNDNINNSSGIVSGILESRQNATAGIIANLA